MSAANNVQTPAQVAPQDLSREDLVAECLAQRKTLKDCDLAQARVQFAGDLFGQIAQRAAELQFLAIEAIETPERIDLVVCMRTVAEVAGILADMGSMHCVAEVWRGDAAAWLLPPVSRERMACVVNAAAAVAGGER